MLPSNTARRIVTLASKEQRMAETVLNAPKPQFTVVFLPVLFVPLALIGAQQDYGIPITEKL